MSYHCWPVLPFTASGVTVAEDSAESGETKEEDCEGGLNWVGAFRGGIVSGATHLLKSAATETVMLLAFNVLFNMIEHTEVFSLNFDCIFE